MNGCSARHGQSSADIAEIILNAIDDFEVQLSGNIDRKDVEGQAADGNYYLEPKPAKVCCR
jgi:hypothetical protein